MGGENKAEDAGEKAHSSLQKKDCSSCKLVGAGGCFAGAIYAFHSRSQLPVSNTNRWWLAVIGIAAVGLGVSRILS